MGNLGGRPLKLTKQLIESITNAIRAGAYVETACALNGISKDTYYQWLKKGARSTKDNLYKQFSDAVEVALAQSELRDLLIIDKAANGQQGEFLRDDQGNIALSPSGSPIMKNKPMAPDWKASAWRLERKFSQRWGRREQLAIEHSGKEDGAPIEFKNHSNDDILSEIRELAEILAPPKLATLKKHDDE